MRPHVPPPPPMGLINCRRNFPPRALHPHLIKVSARLGLWVGKGMGPVPAGKPAGPAHSRFPGAHTLQLGGPLPIPDCTGAAQTPVRGGTQPAPLQVSPSPTLHEQSPHRGQINPGLGGFGCHLHLWLGVGVAEALGGQSAQLVQDSTVAAQCLPCNYSQAT